MSEIEKIKKELQSLQERLTKLEETEQNGGRWRPSFDEVYWTTNGSGATVYYFWKDDFLDYQRLSINNVFQTKSEAEFAVERLRVISELKKYAREFVYGKDNWYICYSFSYDGLNNYIYYSYERVLKQTTLYFESEQIAQKAVREVGEDRVKKYYCGIKD